MAATSIHRIPNTRLACSKNRAGVKEKVWGGFGAVLALGAGFSGPPAQRCIKILRPVPAKASASAAVPIVIRKYSFTSGRSNQRTRTFLARSLCSHAGAGNRGGRTRMKFVRLGQTQIG